MIVIEKTTAAALGLNARQVASKRYSTKDQQGQPLEDWDAVVNRVVTHVSAAEQDANERDTFYRDMTEIMRARKFLPNTPCLVNAGRPNGQLAACFVLDVPDSISGIMDHATATARIHQTGGGTGMTYEHLRPAGSLVTSTHGDASGPVSFMTVVNQVTEVVKQGGVRRGANMGMMRVTHPDILRFIHAKNDQRLLRTLISPSTSPMPSLRPSTEKNGFNFRSMTRPGPILSSIQSRKQTMPSITIVKTTKRPMPALPSPRSLSATARPFKVTAQTSWSK